MKKPLLLPLLASSLLAACATPAPVDIQHKPTVIGEQDIQRMAQQGQDRALNAREYQTGTEEHPILAGAPPIPPPPKPVAAGGKPAPIPPISASPTLKR